MTVRHASCSRRDTDNIIVRCQLDNGIVGWGEGVPRPYVTGETINTVMATLERSKLPGQLGASMSDIADAVKLCESILLDVNKVDERNCRSNAARCALELSILDAMTRSCEVPLSQVTETVPESFAIRASNPIVHYSAPITSMSAWKQSVRGRLARWYGFRDCKVKVGVDGVDDSEMLTRVRRAIGQRMTLRADANEAWAADQAVDKISALTKFNIAAIEQPVAHDASDALTEIRNQVDIPIMLDESLCSLPDADRAIECGLCDVFNIRLSKCGGFINSLKIAATAHRVGLRYQLGCQVGETGILSAAGRAFAASVANIEFVEGSYDRFLLKQNVTTNNVNWSARGQALPLDAPGLGVDVDEDRVSRLAQKKIDLI